MYFINISFFTNVNNGNNDKTSKSTVKSLSLHCDKGLASWPCDIVSCSTNKIKYGEKRRLIQWRFSNTKTRNRVFRNLK